MADDIGLTDLVTVHHAELDRYDRVSVGAANAMAVSGWEIVDDIPADPPAVSLDVDPDQQVDLYHPGLDRRITAPAGAARALTKRGGWEVADPDTTPLDGDPADDEQALLAELSGLTPDQLAQLTDTTPLDGDPADDTTPTTED